jgi:hypothetical protein
MGHVEKLNKRLNTLEAQRVSSGISGCDWRRRLAKCNTLLQGREWVCPVPMTPERGARKAAKQAQCLDYFDKLYADDEQEDGHESR